MLIILSWMPTRYTQWSKRSSPSNPTIFFFPAEDRIRDGHVTGVQTCALPISGKARRRRSEDPVQTVTAAGGALYGLLGLLGFVVTGFAGAGALLVFQVSVIVNLVDLLLRSEERRVGRQRQSRACRSR